jgi:tripartite-type tricarboxylate transporter receptor subunit TctC
VAATVPGYESVGISGLFAPAKTPAAIISRLNREFVYVLNQPDVKEKLFSSGVEAVSSSPERLAMMVKSEVTKLGKMIKDAGIRRE